MRRPYDSIGYQFPIPSTASRRVYIQSTGGLLHADSERCYLENVRLLIDARKWLLPLILGGLQKNL